MTNILLFVIITLLFGASKVNARQIVPIHTEYPEKFKEHFGPTVVRYRDGQECEL
ncbi:MAG: hypothetical protein KJ915_08995 [Candidatus Omnitrophica bacterium]|nr:hypothetical protein [Candidatus Omnitrophota bacterium]